MVQLRCSVYWYAHEPLMRASAKVNVGVGSHASTAALCGDGTASHSMVATVEKFTGLGGSVSCDREKEREKEKERKKERKKEKERERKRKKARKRENKTEKERVC